ncbi:DUF5020 family protein [Adhaeribacter pallidiroseus]|uniref:DUF5020 family protein n=1 Tax=Adhaeribacter pallidiroseus TaxID=2072847 RepID=A0A369QMK3_9BACT|nr:DUF5020 family protein [Adhaeribacter pallidiroseus]RDC64436.1 hypothetical protein AHMF7616_03050 [Adhaeribacter pallidiroseus]
MKYLFVALFFLFYIPVTSQNLQLHYDFRHTVDPKLNAVNFPTLSFEYFKDIDTVGTGSFLLKFQADFKGKKNNVAQAFTQISQSLRFWKPKVYLYLNYSGGLGLTPDAYGFYLPNAWAVGVSYPFQWKGAWFATNVAARYNAFDKPSYDPQFTFYFGKGFRNYSIFLAGSFVAWTENQNQGNDYTRHLTGKKFAFFGDPQIWFRVKNKFSAGSKFNIYYHLISSSNSVQLYPTLGTKYQF